MQRSNVIYIIINLQKHLIHFFRAHKILKIGFTPIVKFPHPKGERSEPLEGIHSMNPVVLMLSPQRWLDQGGQNLQGVLRACWRLW